MEPSDPRRTGTRRVRLVTAAVAGGALVGTGALTVVVAQAHPAAAQGTTAQDTGTGTAGPSSSTVTGTDEARPAPPAGGVGSGGHGHAHSSSGSS